MSNLVSSVSDPSAEQELSTAEAVDDILSEAGELLRQRFSPDARPEDGDAVVRAIGANDAAVLAVLRDPLLALRPGSGWVHDELEGGTLPPGERWVVDPVEGNINHVHGLTEWGVTATLVRETTPVVTVVRLPLSGDTYTAVVGQGAFHNGRRMITSAKTDLGASLVGTGQARPGESDETFARIGRSVTAMLRDSLVVRVSVPATLQLVQLAAGRMDVFWQFSDVRSGLLPGMLLVTEAGGKVTDVEGNPWCVGSNSFLAAAPAVHAAAVAALHEPKAPRDSLPAST